MQSLFKVERIPSDTRMREVVDEVDPEDLRPVFNSLFARAQAANALKAMLTTVKWLALLLTA
jgi:hypothetical protein